MVFVEVFVLLVLLCRVSNLIGLRVEEFSELGFIDFSATDFLEEFG